MNKTRDYIQRFIESHTKRIKPKGEEELTDSQRDLYDVVRNMIRNNPRIILRNEIENEYRRKSEKLNLLPTDFCYNLVNVGPDFETKFILRTEKGQFNFVDFDWKADDKEVKITWNPKGKLVPEELRNNIYVVGIYSKGEYRWDFEELKKYL